MGTAPLKQAARKPEDVGLGDISTAPDRRGQSDPDRAERSNSLLGDDGKDAGTWGVANWPQRATMGIAIAVWCGSPKTSGKKN